LHKSIGIVAAGTLVLLGWQLLAQRSERAANGTISTADTHVRPAYVAKATIRTESGDAPTQPYTPDTTASTDPGLSSFVDRKYRYLPAHDLAAHGTELREALQHREALAVKLNTIQQARVPPTAATVEQLGAELAQADERIRQLLHPAEYAEYSLLRDANAELSDLREYADGISHLVPLTHEQERAVLFAKLTYKQQYEQVLRDASLERTELPVWQRMHSYQRVAQAAREYRESFLQQARQSLYSEDQYALLSNYETTELDRELSRLQLVAMRQ
jgi:hypothetical protein